jgi:alpha-beta hydrolase superfamily lysophospholipase
VIEKVIKWSIQCVLWLIIIVLTILLIRAFDSRLLPELKAWHHHSLESEFTAADSEGVTSLDDYLDIEAKVFQELDNDIYQNLGPDEKLPLSRYTKGSKVDPDNFDQNWNRSYELSVPDIRGGVLMVHGLTDSPYSMRHLAKIFQSQGFYVLNLRMPGHGTIPGALIDATWHDWMAATHLGARHVRNRIGNDRPFYFVGYSNGGALAVKYTLDSIEDQDLPVPGRLYLLSPMLGVTAFARFADWHKTLGWIPYFEKFRWQDVLPEYDPFKYNSFPKAAGEQTFLLTRAINEQLEKFVNSGLINQLPPILTFQSLVDATVLISETVDKLYSRLSENNSELLLFDVNRLSEVDSFFRSQHEALLTRLVEAKSLTYTLTLITNASKDSREVIVKTKKPGSQFEPNESLPMAWPDDVYSLSHVAIPIPLHDRLYGLMGPTAANNYINIGTFAPRGEKEMLVVPVNLLMRLRYNPFFDYIEQRIVDTLME